MDRRLRDGELIVFTTFASSLFGEEKEGYQAAVGIINRLRELEIPLVPVTNKTYREIATLRSKLALDTPVIVEYGSGVLIPRLSQQFIAPDGEMEGDFIVKQFGCTHIEARAVLKVIQSTLRINNLRGFGDLSETEVQAVTGLTLDGVKQAKARDFSEIFVTPKGVTAEEIDSTAEEFGFRTIISDRLSCAIGAGASVKASVEYLKACYRRSSKKPLLTMGIGCDRSDREMLGAVDIPIAIKNGEQSLSQWQNTKTQGLSGWIEAIENFAI